MKGACLHSNLCHDHRLDKRGAELQAKLEAIENIEDQVGVRHVPASLPAWHGIAWLGALPAACANGWTTLHPILLQVFAGFCAGLGLANIREYEAKEGKLRKQ
jgi:hypothetical protein